MGYKRPKGLTISPIVVVGVCWAQVIFFIIIIYVLHIPLVQKAAYTETKLLLVKNLSFSFDTRNKIRKCVIFRVYRNEIVKTLIPQRRL